MTVVGQKIFVSAPRFQFVAIGPARFLKLVNL